MLRSLRQLPAARGGSGAWASSLRRYAQHAVFVPTLDESMSTVTIAQWLKRPGDRVRMGETLANLETEKITVELANTAADGYVARLLVQEGSTAKSKQSVAIIVDDESELHGLDDGPAAAKAKASSKAILVTAGGTAGLFGFIGDAIRRNVVFRHHTVAEGKRVLLQRASGKVEVVHGPRRLRLWAGDEVSTVPHYSADPKQYLMVRDLDGKVGNLRGPCSLWFDPAKHAAIHVRGVIPLNANDALVVYRKNQEGVMRREVVLGPQMYVPSDFEWMHNFLWLGQKFQTLKLAPSQHSFTIPSVRTRDNATLGVEVMVFYQLVDVPAMLDHTQDVLAEFHNGLVGDVMDFSAKLTFEQWNARTEAFNQLGTYPTLTTRAKEIGCTIHKVVFKGFRADKHIQEMVETALKQQTKIRFEQQQSEQEQRLKGFELDKRKERADVEHQIAVAAVRRELEVQQQRHEQSLRHERERADQDRLLEQQRQQREVEHLGGLAKLGVDVTAILLARSQPVPQKLIQISGGQAHHTAPPPQVRIDVGKDA